MPFKHCYKLKFVLNNVFNWCNLKNIKICENIIISKFYNDTCIKYYIIFLRCYLSNNLFISSAVFCAFFIYSF